MKIAVSSTGKELDAQIDPRFGRCAYFLIFETNDMSYEAFDNENIAVGGGAGIQSAQFIAEKGATAVITGNCGPNAVRTLSAAGVEIYVGENGTVKDAVLRYKNGELRSTTDPNVSDHYGMGETGPMMGNQTQTSGQGMGMGLGMGGGRGMGRGMGCGRGMGMGRGMGRGMGTGRATGAGSDIGMSGWNESSRKGGGAPLNDQELDLLKQQASNLKKQMEEIQDRIKKLEKK